jgi:hypothetical protein
MNNPSLSRNTRLLCLFVMAVVGMSVLQAKPDNKLAPAEVVAKHLESIGSAEARARVNGIMIKGTCVVTIRLGGKGQVDGQAIMASQGSLNLINMTFDSPAYPGDSLKFDGKKFTASQFKPGARTAFGAFFVQYDIIFKEGLIGGVLSTAWPLLDLKQKNPKLEYAGLKTIGGKQLHALKYTPRKGSDLKIALFFDSETFQHVRTEYEQTIYTSDQQRIGTGSTQRSSNARISVVEEFSDFKPESGLNLPHTYKFELSVESETRPALVDWVFNLTSFKFNEPMDAKEFSGL